jgi:hypothetical protein
VEAQSNIHVVMSTSLLKLCHKNILHLDIYSSACDKGGEVGAHVADLSTEHFRKSYHVLSSYVLNQQSSGVRGKGANNHAQYFFNF